jgi:N-methylhydantoinase A
VQALGATAKPRLGEEPLAGNDTGAARKGSRSAYVPEDDAFRSVPVYDAHRLRNGNRIEGPAIVEAVTTTIVLSASYDGVRDAHGSIVLHAKEERADHARAPSASVQASGATIAAVAEAS